MLGPRLGSRFGNRFGGAFGVGVDQISGGVVDPMSGVNKDATSNIYWPESAAQWTTTFTGLAAGSGIPSFLHNCQDASGNAADAIGSMTLTAGAGALYQQTVAGWSRKALGSADGSTTAGFGTTGGTNPTTTSIAALYYIQVAAVSTTRMLCGVNLAASNRQDMEVLSSGLIRVATTTSSVQVHAGIGVFPLLLVVDRVNSRTRVFTHLEVISPSYIAPTTNGDRGIMKFSALASNTATIRVLGAAWWSGADAAWLSTTAQAKSLLQKLAWTVAY